MRAHRACETAIVAAAPTDDVSLVAPQFSCLDSRVCRTKRIAIADRLTCHPLLQCRFGIVRVIDSGKVDIR